MSSLYDGKTHFLYNNKSHVTKYVTVNISNKAFNISCIYHVISFYILIYPDSNRFYKTYLIRKVITCISKCYLIYKKTNDLPFALTTWQ